MKKLKDVLFISYGRFFYYNEYGLFYEGQELENYDYMGNYLGNVILNKFIIHYNKENKEPYICFNFSFKGKKKSYTFDVYDRLGITYKNFKNTIDKI